MADSKSVVSQVEWSLDGKRFLALDRSGVIHIWRMKASPSFIAQHNTHIVKASPSFIALHNTHIVMASPSFIALHNTHIMKASPSFIALHNTHIMKAIHSFIALHNTHIVKASHSFIALHNTQREYSCTGPNVIDYLNFSSFASSSSVLKQCDSGGMKWSPSFFHHTESVYE